MQAHSTSAVLVLAAALSGCGGSHHAAEPAPSSTPLFIEISGGNLSTIEGTNLGTDAFVIIVDNGVRYRYERSWTSQGGSVVKKTINDLPFEIDGLSIRIGSQSYGPFERGAEVTIKSSGVFEGETLIGELPEHAGDADE